MVSAPAMVAGGIAAGAPAPVLASAPGEPCSLPSATAASEFCLAADAGDSQVSLTWIPPAQELSAQEDDVFVHEGTTSDPDKTVGPAIVDNQNTALVTNLTNGTTYSFWLATGNRQTKRSITGSNIKSNVVSATPMTVPGAPAGLAATPGNAQVTLSWAAPASDGGSPVAGYDIYTGTTADFNGGTPLATVTGTAVTVTGLVDGTTYYFRVTAVNRVGEGPAAQAQAVPVTVPGAPTGLHATPGHARVMLSWTAPASTGGLPISGYIVYAGTSPDGETGTLVNGSPVTETSYTATGLTNGTTYYFKVVAINAAGLSPLSEEASATLPP